MRIVFDHLNFKDKSVGHHKIGDFPTYHFAISHRAVHMILNHTREIQIRGVSNSEQILHQLGNSVSRRRIERFYNLSTGLAV